MYPVAFVAMSFPILCVADKCCVAPGLAVEQYDECKLMMTSHYFQICFAKASAKLRRHKNAMPNFFGKKMTSTKRKSIMSFLAKVANYSHR
jgi:hypothetical protein